MNRLLSIVLLLSLLALPTSNVRANVSGVESSSSSTSTGGTANVSGSALIGTTLINSTNVIFVTNSPITPNRSILMSSTNGNPRFINWHPLKEAPNWERNVDNMWDTQTVAALIPVITTNYVGTNGQSSLPSAKVYYATNNVVLPWFVMWGNLPTNYSAGSPFQKGVFPILPSGGGSYLIRTRTAEITNEFQFLGHDNGQSVVAVFINGRPLGSSNWQIQLKNSTNNNVKLVFPSYRAREITFAVSGYGTTPGFGYAFCQGGGCFFQPQFRDDGCHYVTGDSGIMGFGNGGEQNVTNSAGGFLGYLMLSTGQEWIYDGSGGSGYLAGGVGQRYLDRATNSVPLLIAQGRKVKDIWAMGGGSDNPSNSAALFTAVTNFYVTCSNSFPTIERYCQAPWDAAVGGSYPNAVTNIVAACNMIGVPIINQNINIDTTMLTSPQYVWTSGPWLGHPTTIGHKLLADQFLRYMMTQTNGYRNMDR